jgi:hypothetical protein
LNGRYAKAIRREINKRHRIDADYFMEAVSGLPLKEKVYFCYVILFRRSKKLKAEAAKI